MMNYRLFFIIFLSLNLSAQQLINLTDYQYHKSYFNPAYSCENEYNRVFVNYRNNWVKLKGAPNTFLISSEFKHLNNSFSAYLYNELSQNNFNHFGGVFNYSYDIIINKNSMFRLGLGFVLDELRYSPNNLYVFDENDLTLLESSKLINPNFNIGAVYKINNTEIGISVCQIMNIKSFSNSLNRVKHLYFSMSKKIYSKNKQNIFKPYIILKSLNTSLYQLDIGLLSFISDTYKLGLCYKSSDAISFISGVKIYKNFTINYSYDQIVSKLSKYHLASHNLILEINL